MINPRLSVVTVSWKTGPRLMEAVKAVLAAPGVDEFVMVSHENPPESIAALREMAARHANFTLIETGENFGFSKGCNIGALAAAGDLILFLNPDAILAPGSGAQLKQSALTVSKRPWVIGARILNADGSEQAGGRRGELTPRTAAISFLRLDRLMPGLRNLHWERDALPDTMVPVPTVSGAALMMRRDDFFELGGFDERYFLHVEDIDLCRSVRVAGGDVWFEPRVQILHFGATSQASPLRVETHKAAGFVKYFWKFYPGPLQRLATLLLIMPIYGALWARVAWLAVWARTRDLARKIRARLRLLRQRRRGGVPGDQD
ncbi:glycosyltransferase family 2 protein [Maricaulis sp.]|uniref:glycosyltransferase family 2 protein n=1 Tax=Maricaulis sp. TaxID=1486257 RepID=UPI003A930D76